MEAEKCRDVIVRCANENGMREAKNTSSAATTSWWSWCTLRRQQQRQRWRAKDPPDTLQGSRQRGREGKSRDKGCASIGATVTSTTWHVVNCRIIICGPCSHRVAKSQPLDQVTTSCQGNSSFVHNHCQILVLHRFSWKFCS